MAGSEGPIRVLLRQVAAVQGPGGFAVAVDILEDVDFPRPGPRRSPQHPEAGPVAQRMLDLRLLDGGGHHHLAPGRRVEQPVGPGLDPARGPRGLGVPGRAVTEDDDVEVPLPVNVDVVLRVGHRLDLVGAEDTVTGVVLPVLGVDAGVRRAVEVVRPCELPCRSRVPLLGRGRAGESAQDHEHAEPGQEHFWPGRGSCTQPGLLRAVGPDRCPPAYPRTSCTNPNGIRGRLCLLLRAPGAPPGRPG